MIGDTILRIESRWSLPIQGANRPWYGDDRATTTVLVVLQLDSSVTTKKDGGDSTLGKGPSSTMGLNPRLY